MSETFALGSYGLDSCRSSFHESLTYSWVSVVLVVVKNTEQCVLLYDVQYFSTLQLVSAGVYSYTYVDFDLRLVLTYSHTVQ